MEPIWQQIDDSRTAFEPPDLGVDAATIEWRQQLRVDTAILDAVYLHQNQLDDKISQQLSSSVLVDAHTMLDAEDRQDIMLDTNESFAYQEDEEKIIMETANLTIVLDDLPSIKPPKPPPTPPSVAIPPNMSFNASLPRQQQTQMGWESFAYKEDEEKIIMETANLTIVLDDLPSIKPPKTPPTPPSVAIPPNSMPSNASLPDSNRPKWVGSCCRG
jgi:hypothetical protein